MAFRRFRKTYEYRNDAGEKITIPRNWAGDLPDDVAKAADEAGVTLIEKSVASIATTTEKMANEPTKDTLLAEAKRRNLTIKPSALKADIWEALRLAAEPFPKALADLTPDELRAEVARRGLALSDEAADADIRAALTLASEQLPA